jgi:CheY-like chemotaxis protein
VLFVDDERDYAELCEQYLGAAGWDVAITETGDDALVIARAYVPDVIVMDLAMPGLDGFQTMLRLKVDARTTRIPIVVLTGTGEDGRVKRAMRVGAKFVLTKPCSGEDLKAVLEAAATSSDAKV